MRYLPPQALPAPQPRISTPDKARTLTPLRQDAEPLGLAGTH